LTSQKFGFGTKTFIQLRSLGGKLLFLLFCLKKIFRDAIKRKREADNLSVSFLIALGLRRYDNLLP
jgi:hypothetical protein